MKTVTFYSDNVAPYRIQLAEGLSNYFNIRFCYQKDFDSDRNDSWLIKESKKVKLVKLKSKIIHNKAYGLSVINDIKKNESDIIVFDGYGFPANGIAIIYMALLKKAYYLSVDGFYINKKNSFFKKSIKKLFFSKHAKYLCSSDVVKKYLIENFSMKTNKVCVTNFSSIHKSDILLKPIAENQKNEEKILLGLKPIKTIVAVGRFLDWKKFDLLLTVFSRISNKSQLVLIGEGPELKHYIGMTKSLNIQNCYFKNFMSYSELCKYYRAADIFVHPADGEIWGLVVNEAVSFGLPAVASSTCISGISMLDHSCIFRANDSADLENKILYAFDNIEKLSNKNLKIAKQYNIENSVNIIKDFLKNEDFDN